MFNFFKGAGQDELFGLARHAATAFGPLLALGGIDQADAMTAINQIQVIAGALVTLAGLIASMLSDDKKAKRERRRRERELAKR
ncbi:MAG: hypothetical protein AAF899_09685 [Pseudomonadota bacterium]